MRILEQLAKSNGFCLTGLATASLFVALSLTPSLLPRPYLIQALLSGFILITGYGIGVLLIGLWRYLELPVASESKRHAALKVGLLISVLLQLWALQHWLGWQNELRANMGLELLGGGTEYVVILLAWLLALVLLLVARLLGSLSTRFSLLLYKFIPQKSANVLAIFIVAVLLLALTNDLVIRRLLHQFDEFYSTLDRSSVGDAPGDSWATGSSSSLIEWETLGRAGENFVTEGPRQIELKRYLGATVQQPVRVYVGYRSADDVEARAQLALAELIRVGGFERSKLIIATPTGTGWHDPAALDPLEYLHYGDTAIVTMQYSYLPSWLTLLLDPLKSRVSAAALYRAIHGYWRTLPKGNRPDLYVYGLSLGALGAETSIQLSTLISDPLQGGVFAGAPFMSPLSPLIIRQRNPGSTEWLPKIADGSLIRFTNQDNSLQIPGAEWGPMRFVFIQYGGDPMVFMSPDLYRREPDWLKEERAPDVSAALRWYPLITFVQLLFDLPMADRIARGNAHNYAASSYIDAWIEVTEPKGWDNESVTLLKAHFEGN